MAVTPSGPISLPLANVQALLAHCTTWQTWLGGGTPLSVANAKLKTYLLEPDPPAADGVFTAVELAAMRPFAVVELYYPTRGVNSGFDPARVALGTYRFVSHLVLRIEDNVDAEETARDAMLQFCNDAGGVLEEMLARAGTSDYLEAGEAAAGIGIPIIKSLAAIEQPNRCEADAAEAQGDHIRGQWLIELGW